MTRIIILLIFLFSNFISLAQYKIEHSLVFESVNYNLKDDKCSNILDVNLTVFKNKVFLEWKVINDTIPGTYLIYKSYNCKNFQTVGSISIVTEVKNNISYYLSVEDTNFSYDFNFYHIVKLLKKEPLFSNQSILEKSCINLDITKKENLQILDRNVYFTDNLTSN